MRARFLKGVSEGERMVAPGPKKACADLKTLVEKREELLLGNIRTPFKLLKREGVPQVRKKDRKRAKEISWR